MKKGFFLIHDTFPSQRELWLISFVYAFCMAIFFQKVIVSSVPSLHGVNGLIPDDAIFFHQTAINLSERIRAFGWSEWRLYPAAGATANVSILAAVYVIMGVNSLFFVPITAALHATGSTLIYRIGSNLWEGKIGIAGGLVGAVAFLIFPSSLLWYGQNLKDTFSITGILFVIDAWLRLQVNSAQSPRKYSLIFLGSIFGIFLIGIVRPYLPILLTLSLMISFCFLSIPIILIKRIRGNLVIVYQSIFIIVLLLLSIFFFNYGSVVSDTNKFFPEPVIWRWHVTSYMPSFIDRCFKKASEIRAYFIEYGRSVSAGSDIDSDRAPNDLMSAILYMPRALQIGLFSPFPDMWREKLTASRIVVSIETAVWYVISSGIFFLIFYKRNVKIFSAILICSVLLTINAYCTPNIGTLYRVRYASWLIFLMLGAVGWVGFLRIFLFSGVYNAASQTGRSEHGNSITLSRQEFEQHIGSGIGVFAITMFGYGLFFVRDMILVYQVGIGAKLDYYFIAIIIPTFLLSAFSSQITEVVMPQLLLLKYAGESNKIYYLIRKYLANSLIILLPMVLGLEFFSDDIINYILPNLSLPEKETSINILRIFSLILFMSPWMAVGNAYLNVMNRSKVAALGQLIVPIVAISFQLMCKDEYTVVATVAGMTIGTFLNILWLMISLKNCNIYLIPTYYDFKFDDTFFVKYLNLTFPSLITATTLPLSYYFSSHIGVGAIAAWSIVSKIIFLLTGSVGAVTSSVFLPYMMRAFSRENKDLINTRGFYIMIMGSIIGGAVAVLFIQFVYPIANLLSHSHHDINNIKIFTAIFYVGLIQLPVAVAFIMLTKISIAADQSVHLILPSAVSFLSNFLICFFLVPEFGMVAVASGAFVSSILSTVILLSFTHKKIGLKSKQLIVLVAVLLLWVVTLIFEIFGNYIAMLLSMSLISGLIIRAYIFYNRLISQPLL